VFHQDGRYVEMVFGHRPRTIDDQFAQDGAICAMNYPTMGLPGKRPN
jgi:hypothetical protein